MDEALNSLHQDTIKLKARLDVIEVDLVSEGQRCSLQFDNWRRGIAGKLSMSASMAAISYKRKRKRNEWDE